MAEDFNPPAATRNLNIPGILHAVTVADFENSCFEVQECFYTPHSYEGGK